MSEPLRVLVADDELMARKRLLRLLGELPAVVLAGECKDGGEVLERIAEGGVDVVLLDIHMPGLSWLEAMQRMPEDGPYVIFCTAHPEHAVSAFDAGAVDYVLKPVEAVRLGKALERARSRDAVRRFREELRRQRHLPQAKGVELSRLPVSTRQGIVLVDPKTICHARLDGELITIATTDGDLLTDATLQDLESRLPPCFMRVHRRALVNLEHVVRLEPSDTGGFVARTTRGDGVQVSRQSARELRRTLGLRRPADEGEGDDDD